MGQSVLIHARFLAAAEARPDALAIASDEGRLSYAQLARLSRRFAGEVLAAGGGPGRVVAILAERGPRPVVAALACAMAGAPFVILDLAYPRDRLAALAAVCRPKLQLLAARTGGLPDCGPAIAIDLDARRPAPDAPAPEVFSPDAPAYLLFTSGSTGAPKCLAISHRPLVNFVEWQARTFALTAADRFTMLSGLSHDPVLRDIFTPLSLGASLHIPAQKTLTEPGALAAWFAKARPTAAHMTPPLGVLLTAGRTGASLDELRYVFWGGDVLRRSHVEALAAIAPNVESVNFYGATETPQAASCFRVPGDFAEDRAPIGEGVDGFTLEIRDDDACRVEGGAVGEIIVRSPFLTLGRVQDGVLPFGRAGADGYYATGDIGHRRADGQIVIHGRRDDQVKIRGHRVELAEITAAALTALGVAQAITLNVGEPGEARLCTFVESSGGRLDAEAVRAHLAARLPGYMVPAEIEVASKLPLLPNGKIDRQALIARQRVLDAAPPPQTAVTAPPGKAAELVESWQAFFGRQTVTQASSFASLGGDSLSYVSAYLSLEEALGEVPDDWTTMTIAELAATAQPADVKRSALVTIESAILMRAAAICVVVGSHFGLFFSGGAGTSALLWVSGSIFGALQLREMDHDGKLAPIGRLLKSILIPLYLIELPQFLAKLALHANARLSSVLLTTDLLDYTGTPNSGPDAYGHHEYLLWYIHAVVHILIAYAALLLLAKFVLRVRRPATVAAFAAVGLGIAGRFLLPALFQAGFWADPVDPMSYFNHAPTTHLATFALAALAGLTAGRWRWPILAATLVYVAASVPIYGAADSLPIAGIALVLCFAPKISVPRALSTPIYVTAGASFFIYLLQFKFWAVASHLHVPALAAWPAAVAGGVAVWAGWNWVSQRAGGWLAARRTPIRSWRLAGQGA